MFYSLPSFSAGNSDSLADPLPNLFPEIPSILLSQLIPSLMSLLLLIPPLMSLLQPILPSTSLLSLPLLQILSTLLLLIPVALIG